MQTQLRLTQESPRRRGRPSSVRLSEASRRAGREGVAMARRELDRVRNSTVASSRDDPMAERSTDGRPVPGRPAAGGAGKPAAPDAASARSAA